MESSSRRAPEAVIYPKYSRLEYFLAWLIPLATLFGCLEAVAFVLSRHPAIGIASISSFVCATCYLFARRLALRGRTQQAVFIICGSLLVITLIGALVWGELLMLEVMLPLVAVAVGLPYLTGRSLQGLIALAWVVMVLSLILSRVRPFQIAIPTWITTDFEISTFATVSGLFLLLLWQFSARLTATLNSTQAANVAAQEALATRDHFVSIAAHELRTPITALLGFVDLLQRRVTRLQNLPEREAQLLDTIRQQGSRLNQLVLMLLDLSRLESGTLAIGREPVVLDALVGRVIDETRSLQTKHTLAFHCPEKHLVMLGDPLRLEQIIHNLVQNAIKYSPEGGDIVVDLAGTTEQITLTISDHGIGIPVEAQASLFERFYRAPNAVGRQINGLGVGLSVVKELVTLHDGTIGVASSEGQGSTFTLTFPRLANDAATPPLTGTAASE